MIRDLSFYLAQLTKILILLTAVLIWENKNLPSNTIKSNGNVFLDPNSDGNLDGAINSTGFGIGNSSPSHRLHVNGNTIIPNGKIGIGISPTGNSMQVEGSMAMGIQSISSNTTLSDTTVNIVDTTSGNITLQLPTASTVTGRIYHIKKKDDDGEVLISGANIDGFTNITMTTQASPLPFLELISYDSVWFVLSGNGYTLQ